MTTNIPTSAEVRRQTLAAYNAGLCPVPPKEDGSKMPLDSWKQYQSQRPTREQLDQWYSNGRTGLGLVSGAVSGNLECFEIDDLSAYRVYKELALASGLGELLDRIEKGFSELTPNGAHMYWGCAEIGPSTKLARRPKLPEEMRDAQDRVKFLLETRGEGGYVICQPSYGTAHPSGQPYRLVHGGFDSIPTITPEERELLLSLARSLDQIPKREVREARPISGSKPGGRPGDDFNARGQWPQILEPFGWRPVFERNGEIFWRRPGKTEGVSATTGFAGTGYLYVFSTSTPFEAERGYSKFAAYALLNHNGDHVAAARALAQMGYGDQPAGNVASKNPHRKVYLPRVEVAV
jgi:hypothetical protein